jgi:hypothetical protein
VIIIINVDLLRLLLIIPAVVGLTLVHLIVHHLGGLEVKLIDAHLHHHLVVVGEVTIALVSVIERTQVQEEFPLLPIGTIKLHLILILQKEIEIVSIINTPHQTQRCLTFQS